MTSVFSWQTLLIFALLHFILQSQTCPLFQVPLDFPFLHSMQIYSIQQSMMKRTSLFGASPSRCQMFSQNLSTSASSASVVGAQTYLIVMLNHLPWKGNKIILSFLRLHPSTAFWTPVDYEGYSISSKGFFPTVVDIRLI